MFWDKSQRFSSRGEVVARPYTDAAVVDRDDIARTHKGGPKIVDDWYANPAKDRCEPVMRPAPPSSPPHSHTHTRTHSLRRLAVPPSAASLASTEGAERTDTASTSRSRKSSPRKGPPSLDSHSYTHTYTHTPLPGPGSYFPERAPQYRPRQGAVSFDRPAVEVKVSSHVALPVPGPGTYFQPSTLLRPTFHRHNNENEDGNLAKQRKQRGRAKAGDAAAAAGGEEAEEVKKHRIVLELERLSLASSSRSSQRERGEVRAAAMANLQRLTAIEQRVIAPFVWPPPVGERENERDGQGSPLDNTPENDVDISSYVDNIVRRATTQIQAPSTTHQSKVADNKVHVAAEKFVSLAIHKAIRAVVRKSAKDHHHHHHHQR